MKFYYGDKVKLNAIHQIKEIDGTLSGTIPKGTQGTIQSTDPHAPYAYILFDCTETKGRNIPVPYKDIEKVG